MTATDLALFVDDDAQFVDLCKQWQQVDFLALDTEFIRTDTFYPIAGLLQVSDGHSNYLLDPLKITDFSAFAALMKDQGIVKVLHSCSEDLEVFDRLVGELPSPLFDTQIAAAISGLGFSMSYQRLVEALLDIHVEKGETRSNWLQRPLTQSQCHYAALDVEHLPKVYHLLSNRLTDLNRSQWLVEECEASIAKYHSNEPYYKKVKSAWKLSSSQLGLLEQLTTWREQQARARDVPRGRIIKDRSCFEIAAKPPRSKTQLSAVEDITSKIVRTDGDTILSLIEQYQANPSNLPALPKPLPKESSATLKQLKEHVRIKAQQLDVPAELLVKKRDYEAIIRSGLRGAKYQLPSTLQGWRQNAVANDLLALLNR